MIVNSMTYSDILNLYLKDQVGIIKHKMDEAYAIGRRWSIKTTSKQLQFMNPIEFQSKKTGLNYIIQIVNFGNTYSKKDRIGVGLYSYFYKDYGLHAATITNDIDGIKFNILTPHFLDRYRERYLKDKTILKIQAILRFYMSNRSYLYTDIPSEKYSGNCYIVCNDGLGLGIMHNKHIVEFKTFITFEMLHQDQADIIEEAESAIAYFRQNCKPLEIPKALWVNIKTKEIIPEFNYYG